jgi:hypothetical protein
MIARRQLLAGAVAAGARRRGWSAGQRRVKRGARAPAPHNGSITLWCAEVEFDPARGVAVLAAANDGRLQTVAGGVGAAQPRR